MVEPRREIQSLVVWIPAQVSLLMTNWLGSKQREVRLGGRERDSRFFSRSLRQETEVARLGRRKFDVCLRR